MTGHQRALVAMTSDEIDGFLRESRTMALSSHNADGSIHCVAMWYGFIGGDVAFSTRMKSQKAVNILRNRNVTCLIESASRTYDELRGVEIIGEAEIVDDPARRFEQGRSSYERNVGDYTDAQRSIVDGILDRRLVVRVRPVRVVSWDHAKLAPRGQVPLSALRRAQIESG